MDQFISNSEHKTPPMKVQVIDMNGKVTHTYDAPAGFQLDRYVASLFPMAEIMFYRVGREVNASVIIPKTDEIYQIHRGVYL